MSDYIEKIRTKTGDKQIDYNSLGNLPVADTTLALEGHFADSKTVGDKFSQLSKDKISTPSTGTTNQILAVKSVDSNGKPSEFKCVDKAEIPTSLKNPYPLTFTGAVTGSYDGSEAVSVEIPSGGGGGAEQWTELLNVECDGETYLYTGNSYSFKEIEAYIILKTGFESAENLYFTNGSNGTIYEEPRIYATLPAGWTGQVKLSRKIIKNNIIEGNIVASNYANPASRADSYTITLYKYGINYNTPFSVAEFTGHTLRTANGTPFPNGTLIYVRGC